MTPRPLPKVFIVGGGFAGLAAAKVLADAPVGLLGRSWCCISNGSERARNSGRPSAFGNSCSRVMERSWNHDGYETHEP